MLPHCRRSVPGQHFLIRHVCSCIQPRMSLAWSRALGNSRSTPADFSFGDTSARCLRPSQCGAPPSSKTCPRGVAGVQQAVSMIRERLETIEQWTKELDEANMAFETPEHGEDDLRDAIRDVAALALGSLR